MCGVNSEDIDQCNDTALRGYLDHEVRSFSVECMTVWKQFICHELPFKFLKTHTCIFDHWVQRAREVTNQRTRFTLPRRSILDVEQFAQALSCQCSLFASIAHISRNLPVVLTRNPRCMHGMNMVL